MLEYNQYPHHTMDLSFRFLEDSQAQGFGDIPTHSLFAGLPVLSILDDISEKDSQPAQINPLLLMREKLQRAGFNLNNQNMFCIQMVNALQAQMDVLQRVIFKHAPHDSIFGYGLGFDEHFDETFCFERQLKEGVPQFNYLASGKKVENYKHGLVLASKAYSSSQEEVMRIVDLKWERVTDAEQWHYLALRKKIDEVKRVITECLTRKQGKDHVCVLCGDIFQNGRQLGGHMSRKHPGNSADYNKKKKMHARKTVERERRRYFKGFKTAPKPKKKSSATKDSPACVKIEQK